MARFGLVENLQRDDLSPLDAALGLLRFQETQQLSIEALAMRTGWELDRVKRLVRLHGGEGARRGARTGKASRPFRTTHAEARFRERIMV